jgi:histone acetyltransferase 1
VCVLVFFSRFRGTSHVSDLAALYTAIYEYVLLQPRISELTVEDPAEAFEDLRDRMDLRMLLDNVKFMEEGFGDSNVMSSGGGKVGGVKPGRRSGRSTSNRKGKIIPPADKIWLEKWRVQLKIAGVRQLTKLCCCHN